MGFNDFAAAAENITAEQLEEDRAVITPNGPREGKAGGWEVRSKDGNVQYLDDDDFQAKYGSGESKDAPSLDEEDNRKTGSSQMNNLQDASSTGSTDSGSAQNESDEKESAREDSTTREDDEEDDSKTSKTSSSSSKPHKDLEDERFPRK